MVLRKPRLNNIQLNYQRNDLVYETVMIDLYLMGLISKDICQAFTGREVSDVVRLPTNALELEASQSDVEL
jgi:hypothetical protein